MKKNLLATLPLFALMIGANPNFAYADTTNSTTSQVTLNAIANSTLGSNVNISGSTNLPEVNIKVIGPNQANLFFDVKTTSNGIFTDSFTIPTSDSKWTTGTYTVVVGQGSTVATTSFQLTSSSSGGSNSSGTTTSTSTTTTGNTATGISLTGIVPSDKVTIDISSSTQLTVDKNGVVQVSIDSAKTISNIQNSQANTDVFVLSISVQSSANAVSVPISSDIIQAVLVKGGTNASIVVSSQFGNYKLPLQALQIATGSTVSVTIAKADAAVAQKATAVASAKGLSLAGTPINFTVTVTDKSGNSSQVESFANTYVSRSVNAGNVNPKNTVAVMINDSGSFVPVPTFFVQQTDGSYVAVINRTGNSTYALVTGNKTFSDIKGFWAQADIENMASHLLVSGESDSVFAPQDEITRAQFASLLVRALGLTDRSASSTFTDVTSTDWFSHDVNIAASLGLVKGYNDAFAPNDPITREQMAAMIMRAAQFTGKTFDSNATNLKFKDADKVDSWAKSAIQNANQIGIIHGDPDGNVRPTDHASRSEGTVMLEHFMQYLKFLN